MTIDQWNKKYGHICTIRKIDRPLDPIGILCKAKEPSILVDKVIKLIPTLSNNKKTSMHLLPKDIVNFTQRVEPIRLTDDGAAWGTQLNLAAEDDGILCFQDHRLNWDCNPLLSKEGQFIYWDNLIVLCNQMRFTESENPRQLIKARQLIEAYREMGYKKGLTNQSVCVMVRKDGAKSVLQFIYRDGSRQTRSVQTENLKSLLEEVSMATAKKKPAAKPAASRTRTAAKKSTGSSRRVAKAPAKVPAKKAAAKTATAKKAPAKAAAKGTGGLPTGQREGMGQLIFKICNAAVERSGKKPTVEQVTKAVLKKTDEYSEKQIAGRFKKWQRIYNQLNSA